MKNIVSAMLKMEPNVDRRSLALVILSMVSGYFAIIFKLEGAKIQKILFLRPHSDMKLLRRLLRYLRHYKSNIAFAIVANLLYALFSIFTLSMIVPFLSVLFNQVQQVTARPEFSLTSRYVIDTFYYYMGVVVAHFGQRSALLYIAIVMIIVSFCSNLFRYASMYCLAPLRSGMLKDMRNDFYHRLIILPLSFYSEQRKGDIISRIGADVQECEWSIFASLLSICRDPVMIAISLVVLFTINVRLTLVSMVILPLMGYLLASIGKHIRNYSLRSQRLLGQMSSLFDEAIGGLRVIKGYNAQQHAAEKFRHQSFQFYRLNKKMFRISELGSPLVEFLSIVAMMAILLLGMLLFPDSVTMKGTMLMLYFVVFARMIAPAKSLVTTYYTLQKGLSAAERVFEIMDADEVIVERENALPIHSFKDKIEFRDVSFSYRNASSAEECEVLHHVNFELPKGKTIALVGPSGSGKSTIVDLIPRFFDIQFGEILVDGKRNEEYVISDLRGLFGIVNQDVILFNDTVFNNIAFGLENVSEEQVVAAAKIAQAHQFITEMEQGYQTVLGDRGMRLSGGQRQRISIARALLRNPEIFILDEATSALDNESEYQFQEALTPLLSKRTGIIIAHRLSTIRFADEILFIRDGRIIEQGSHQQLMERQGAYYTFYTTQQQ